MTTACVLIASPGHTWLGHPEIPDRFNLLGNWESKPYAASLMWLGVNSASLEEITTVHTEQMVQALKMACQQGERIIEFAPTYVTHTSFDDALLAVGGTLACTRAVLGGLARNAFAIIRPPGHHAEPHRPMGFCLVNNIAVAAQAALASGVSRLLIVDFDAHHGNGTQAAFVNDERVAYFSTHQENIYPGTGSIEDAPRARERIINLPLLPRAGDACFAAIASQILMPFANRFAPQMIFVSVGFDAHWSDPLACLGLSSAGYYALSKRLVELAGELCGGKVIFVLEGGYNPQVLASGVDAVLSALTGIGFEAHDPSPHPEPDIQFRLDQIKQRHVLYNYRVPRKY